MGITASYYICIGNVGPDKLRVALRLTSVDCFFPSETSDPILVATGYSADFILATPDKRYKYIFSSYVNDVILRKRLETAISAGSAKTYAEALQALPPDCAKLLSVKPSACLDEFSRRHSAAAPTLFQELKDRAGELASHFCQTTDPVWKSMACHICGSVPLHKPGQTFASMTDEEKNAIRAIHYRCDGCGKFWCRECTVGKCGVVSLPTDDSKAGAVNEWCPYCNESCTCRTCRMRCKSRRKGAF